MQQGGVCQSLSSNLFSRIPFLCSCLSDGWNSYYLSMSLVCLCRCFARIPHSSTSLPFLPYLFRIHFLLQSMIMGTIQALCTPSRDLSPLLSVFALFFLFFHFSSSSSTSFSSFSYLSFALCRKTNCAEIFTTNCSRFKGT